jgi:starvation-inducible DNA-binding protein
MNQDLVATLYAIANVSKTCHWNVHGPMFEGLHARFDLIETGAQELGDRVAERARFQNVRVSINASALAAVKGVDEVATTATATVMLNSMISNFNRLIVKCDTLRTKISCDNAILDDIQEWAGLQVYFLRSSL